jgi:hypothetical protein
MPITTPMMTAMEAGANHHLAGEAGEHRVGQDVAGRRPEADGHRRADRAAETDEDGLC